MGELSKADAERLRKNYIKLLDQAIFKIQHEFAEMDFINTDKDAEMQQLCEDTIRVCTNAQCRLSGMMFLAVEDYE